MRDVFRVDDFSFFCLSAEEGEEVVEWVEPLMDGERLDRLGMLFPLLLLF